ncbi:MAG: methylmalonyl-CoA mutase family protein [Caldilineaceae bacterium]
MTTEDLSAQENRWHAQTLDPLVKRFGERQERFTTSSDSILVEPLYTPTTGATDAEPYLTHQGFSGEYPFTRGVQPNMYRGRLWTMRQYAGFSTAAESNRRYHYLLQRGQTGLSVAFDLPTQIGYDADHELAEGEVGKVGVSISSLRDMETLLDGIPLDKVSISMTINAPAAILLAMVIAVGKQQGVSPSQLRGTIQNDILKEYIARGTYIFPPAPSMRLITDIFRYCAVEVPKWNTISISGYHMREAGSTAVQEVAFTLANGIEYVQQALKAGLNIDSFAGQLSFFFNAHNNFLEEIAKFRAARRLWARTMRDRFHAQQADSCKLRFHTQTGGSTLTAQQPENNIVRVALQALAAVLGGTQSLHTNGMDEALALPTEKAVEIALRTQQIIAYESGVADTVDPLGGSYYIEQLTDAIERQAADYIARIDALGGALKAVEEGFIQREIQDAAYKTQRAIERNEQVVVGVNRYQTDEAIQADLLRVDEQVRLDQMAALQTLRAERDQERVQAILQRIGQAARTPDAPLMPLFVEAVEAYVTLGEICDALRAVFGEYQPESWV